MVIKVLGGKEEKKIKKQTNKTKPQILHSKPKKECFLAPSLSQLACYLL